MFKITKGEKVISRTGTQEGKTTGGSRHCSLEGCRGLRIAVRWPSGKLTYPCTKGMTSNADGSWRIE